MEKKTTLIVFSGDLDKAMAGFIIANGAAAMGNRVTMFFTFWGLSLLRKPRGTAMKKSFPERMFGAMLPKGPDKAGVSKMNFGGLGAWMMKKVMKRKNIATLHELMETAKEQGVRLVACTMSMDVLGIRKEELIDGLDFAGVATYLAEAQDAEVNLFI